MSSSFIFCVIITSLLLPTTKTMNDDNGPVFMECEPKDLDALLLEKAEVNPSPDRRRNGVYGSMVVKDGPDKGRPLIVYVHRGGGAYNMCIEMPAHLRQRKYEPPRVLSDYDLFGC